MLHPGRATPSATAAHARGARPGLDGLSLSGVGLGSYLGTPDDETDGGYAASAAEALRLGGNVIDTAINYRYQRSERALGAALRDAFRGGLPREAVVVCTKAGFIPLDPETAQDPSRYVYERLLDPGVIVVEDIAGGSHVMTPGYLRHQAAQSRRNLGLQTLDVFYLHNPDVEVRERPEPEFWPRLRACVEELERMADDGWIGCYGVATWGALRVPPESPEHLSLERVLRMAREVAGEGHRFRAVQAPLNLAMPEALAAATQPVGSRRLPLLQAAGELGLTVFASGSLAQGRLAGSLPRGIVSAMPDLPDDAARALQFTRSAPGLATALVGMKTPEHVRRNLALLDLPPLDPEALQECLDTVLH